MPETPTISVIVPVRDGGPSFQRCLTALAASTVAPREIIVVDDGSTDESRRWAEVAGMRVLSTARPGSGPALARNLAAQQASGVLLFFLDADVEVRPETLAHIGEAFGHDPGLAALFGSYDDAPGDPGFISQYKNLMHHYVHQHGAEQASTFWSGCGVIRRELFLEYGGFSTHYAIPSIEDIELGSALTRDGYRIGLDKSLQVKHLKRWTLPGLLHSDIVARGIPWTRLILRLGRMPNDLNLQTAGRVSVGLVYGGLLGLLLGFAWPAAWAGLGLCALALLWLNRDVYAFFWRKRGPIFALGAAGMHWLYYGYNGLAFGWGAALHVAGSNTRSRLGEWAMLAVLLVAAGLRLHRLGAPSMWLDELLEIGASGQPIAHLLASLPQYSAMPLDYVVAHFVLQLGEQDFWLRVPAALWSTLTVALMYRFVGRMWGRRVGVAAAALLAVAPFAVHYGQEARPYALWGLASLSSFYFLFRALNHDRVPDWIGYSVSLALALLTHLFTLFALGTQALMMLIALAGRPARTRLTRFTLAALAAAAGLLLTPYPASVLGVGQVFAASLFNPQSFVAAPELKPNQGSGPILDAEFLRLDLLGGLSGTGAVWPWLFLGLAALGLIAAARIRPRTAALLLLWALVPVAVTIAFLVQRGTFFAVRYVTPAFLALVVLMSLGVEVVARGAAAIARIRSAGLRQLLWAVALMIPLGFSLASTEMYYRMPKEDWRTAGGFVDANFAPGDAVVAPLGGAVIFHYALGARAGRLDVSLPEALPPVAGRLWFIQHPYLGPAGLSWDLWLSEQAGAVGYQIDDGLRVVVVGRPAAETLAQVSPPDTAFAYASIGAKYEQIGDPAQAESSFRHALDLGEAPALRVQYADFLRRQDRLDEAAAQYLQALTRDPNSVPALIGLSRVYLRRNLPEEAITALEWAAQQAPDDYGVNLYLAQAYEQIGQAEAAARFRDRAAQSVPDLVEPP